VPIKNSITSMRCKAPSPHDGAGADRAVHARRMDFVDIAHGAVSLGEIMDVVRRCHVVVNQLEP
jgi:hypothetical protein